MSNFNQKMFIFGLFLINLSLFIYVKKKYNLTSKTNYELKHNQTIIDSLRQEIYIYELQLNRYEITLDILKERDYKTYEIFENTMSMETE
jgi:hypothetical protein